ncbi:MAG: MlaD family protein [Gammaproteobacteria bacterium]
MSDRSNPAIIGSFVLGAIALLVIAVVVFGGSELFSPKRYLVTYFDGSVKGLRVGSNVLFRGVRVGYVTNIEAVTDPDVDQFGIPVTFQILPDSFTVMSADGEPMSFPRTGQRELIDELIKSGLRAKLETESFVTGQLLIQLDFYPALPAVFRGVKPRYQEIPSVPSDIQQVLERLQRFAKTIGEKIDSDRLITDFEGVLAGLNRLANSPDLAATLAGLNRLANSPDTQALPGELRRATNALTATLDETRQAMAKLDQNVGPLAADTRQALAAFNVALERTAGVLQETEVLLSQEGAAKVELARTLGEVQRAARSLRLLADYLSLQPEALVRGKPDQEGSR